jgi:hypothetical protein
MACYQGKSILYKMMEHFKKQNTCSSEHFAFQNAPPPSIIVIASMKQNT